MVARSNLVMIPYVPVVIDRHRKLNSGLGRFFNIRILAG